MGFWWTYVGVANRRFEPAGFLPNYAVASTLQFGHTGWALRNAMRTRGFRCNDSRHLYDFGVVQVAVLSAVLSTAAWLMLSYADHN